MRHYWNRDTIQLTREQLYDLVWSEPMQRLSKQIGISDVAIAKHCRRIGVPVPERGYWNKLQAGHKVTRTPLPERDLATIRRIHMTGKLPDELRAHIKGEPGKYDAANDDIETLTERFRKRLGKISVPRNFQRTHPIIAALLRKDEEYRQAIAKDRYAWRKPLFDAPFERRRLLFLNGLFLGFDSVGAAPSLHGQEARELSIHMGDASVSFDLDRVKSPAQRRRGAEPAPEPKEKLRLTVSGAPLTGVPMQWEDQEGAPLESQITEVIVGMAVAGEHLHRRWLEQQAEWERQRREEAEREARRQKEEAEKRERARLAAIEKAKLDNLLQSAEAWRAAHNLRDYITAVKEAAGADAGNDAFQAWARWASAEADKLDPISSGRAMGVNTPKDSEEDTCERESVETN